MMRAPTFWYGQGANAHPFALLLAPLGSVYARLVAQKIAKASPTKIGIPVICAGNVTLGGVGKTPFVDLLAQRLSDMGHTPFILMRGYGGKLKGPMRVRADHTARDVGDEACMLARHHPVIISSDRPAGASLAVSQGATVLVMDDGFQNPSLHKDFSFILIDGGVGLGNGRIFPAGPLREDPDAAFRRADSVVIVNPREETTPPATIPKQLPCITAFLNAQIPANLQGLSVHAFSGIGRPDKFFLDLEKNGLLLRKRTPFADHHHFSPQEIERLKRDAKADNALLVTTEKDSARLSPEEAEGIEVILARMGVDDPALLDKLLKKTLGEPL